MFVSLLTDRDKISNLYKVPSIYVSYKVSIHLANQFQRRRFLEIDQSETSIAYGGHVCLRSKRNEQSIQRTFHRCFQSRFGSFGKAVSEEKIFRNRQIRNKKCLRWPCLLMDGDEMSNLYRRPSKDASYQVSVHLAKWFQRRRFLEIDQSETRIFCGSHVC